ncbi:ABC1 kinase family protein [Niallia endozanthoxylica]|uniref:AarF/ABC1/UbiB kinase family protein n=1 Tax=Niallia endozanthoxylica TaxID=2036016 RepID=A0A5J5HAY7_9BACI|nr:AarF/UbiB family protein [Niallia endozanthoxylica]KAA9017068.1 AarF/ABC1/UbiB kinase family protein [Niallia endozanthoxylica]
MKYFSLYRIYTIVWLAVRIFIEIVFFKKRHRGNWNDKVEQQWEELLRRQAHRYKEKALYLEGVMIKLGQYLSTRKDIMPDIYIKELTDLLDQVPSVPWEKSKKVIEDEWNKPYSEVLHEISAKPIASASIGEVYRGTLHSGEEVAVKIQRPKIGEIIYSDFRAVRIVLWLARRFTKLENSMDLSLFYREFVRTIGDELNFHLELENGLYFQKKYEDFPGLEIPDYYPEYSTKRVLVMEWKEGNRINDLAFLEKHHINKYKISNVLLESFLGQLLNEGKFHADPHPGNIMVKADGTIVLIDFGMIGVIRKRDAMYIRDIVIGILLKDYKKVVDGIEGMRFLLPHADKEEIERVLRMLIETYSDNGLKANDTRVVEEIMNDIEKLVNNQPIQLPSEYAFLGRAISTFIGILYSLDPEMDLLEMSKPMLTRWLKENSEGAKETVVNFAKSSLKPLVSLPNQLQQALEEPRKYREWKRTNEIIKMKHEMVVSRKRDAFLLCLLSCILIYVSFYLNQYYLLYASSGLLLISIAYYIRMLLQHRRLMDKS